MTAPLVSVVIPVYNEEAILRSAVCDLLTKLNALGWSHEVILAENGSRDGTVSVAKALASEFAEVQFFSYPEPNYGAALRAGINRSRGEFILCDEIDLCDTEFHSAAVGILQRREADFVIGSKLLAESKDERPWSRHAASLIYSGILRVCVGFRGTDTHGLKAFRRDALQPVLDQCTLDKDVFASEFVIRAERGRIKIREIPVRVAEKRPPSINLTKRVPAVLSRVARLTVAIRLKKA